MEYIYTDGKDRELIESLVSNSRQNMIDQYIARRKALKLTQEGLAKKLGIARTNITRFESGTYNPSLDVMVKLAAALDMAVEVKLSELKQND